MYNEIHLICLFIFHTNGLITRGVVGGDVHFISVTSQ